MTDPSFPDPADRNPVATGCERCEALVDCRERISHGVGPRDASLVIVGEAPDTGDPTADRWRGGNLTGLAYTTRASGRKVRRLVADAGFGGEAYYTNAVKCFPCDGSGSNREPTAAERANCRPYLLRELEEIAPDCVLATGKHATRTLLAAGDRALDDVADGFLDAVLDPLDAGLGPPVLPLLHPSYQEVWLGRLGYEYEGYVAAVRDTVRDCRDA